MHLAHARLAASLALLGAALIPHAARAQQRDSATVVCKDGTTEQGTGGCGEHGGVDPVATKATQAGAQDAKRPPRTGATLVICHDGTSSTAGNRSCFGHGGVKAEPGARGEVNAALRMENHVSSVPRAKPQPPVAADANGDTTHTKSGDAGGASAQCGDGSYSRAARRSAACVGRGGVKKWLRS
jgi:hypothetical protein